MTRQEKHEQTRQVNHPRRTIYQSRKLADAGWYPFPELSEAENDEILCARLAGYGPCFPVYPDAETQARRTLDGARRFLKAAPSDVSGHTHHDEPDRLGDVTP